MICPRFSLTSIGKVLAVLALTAVNIGCVGPTNKKYPEGDTQFVQADPVPLDSLRSNRTYLTVESLEYNHPISGKTPKQNGWFTRERGSPGSEVQVLVIAYTYDKPEHYKQLKALFRTPYRIDLARVRKAKHYWFEPSFNLSLLPEGVEGGYWMGYLGGIMTKDPDDPNPFKANKLKASDFSAHASSQSNAGQFWPIQLDTSPGHYIYLKVMVFEETGNSVARKITGQVENRSDVEIVIEIVKESGKQDWFGVAKVIGEATVQKALEPYTKEDSLLDVEYKYESGGPGTIESLTIPKKHIREWTGTDRPSNWPRKSVIVQLAVQPDVWPIPPAQSPKVKGANDN